MVSRVVVTRYRCVDVFCACVRSGTKNRRAVVDRRAVGVPTRLARACVPTHLARACVQAVSGALAAGGGRAMRYLAAKVSKAWQT